MIKYISFILLLTIHLIFIDGLNANNKEFIPHPDHLDIISTSNPDYPCYEIRNSNIYSSLKTGCIFELLGAIYKGTDTILSFDYFLELEDVNRLWRGKIGLNLVNKHNIFSNKRHVLTTKLSLAHESNHYTGGTSLDSSITEIANSIDYASIGSQYKYFFPSGNSILLSGGWKTFINNGGNRDYTSGLNTEMIYTIPFRKNQLTNMFFSLYYEFISNTIEDTFIVNDNVINFNKNPITSLITRFGFNIQAKTMMLQPYLYLSVANRRSIEFMKKDTTYGIGLRIFPNKRKISLKETKPSTKDSISSKNIDNFNKCSVSYSEDNDYCYVSPNFFYGRILNGVEIVGNERLSDLELRFGFKDKYSLSLFRNEVGLLMYPSEKININIDIDRNNPLDSNILASFAYIPDGKVHINKEYLNFAYYNRPLMNRSQIQLQLDYIGNEYSHPSFIGNMFYGLSDSAELQIYSSIDSDYNTSTIIAGLDKQIGSESRISADISAHFNDYDEFRNFSLSDDTSTCNSLQLFFEYIYIKNSDTTIEKLLSDEDNYYRHMLGKKQLLLSTRISTPRLWLQSGNITVPLVLSLYQTLKYGISDYTNFESYFSIYNNSWYDIYASFNPGIRFANYKYTSPRILSDGKYFLGELLKPWQCNGNIYINFTYRDYSYSPIILKRKKMGLSEVSWKIEPGISFNTGITNYLETSSGFSFYRTNSIQVVIAKFQLGLKMNLSKHTVFNTDFSYISYYNNIDFSLTFKMLLL